MDKLYFNEWETSPLVNITSKITTSGDNGGFHQHNFYEIFYIMEGSIIHNANGKKETLDSGDIVLLRKSDKHCFERFENQACSHRDIIITESQFEKTCKYLSPNILDFIINHPTPLKAKLTQARIFDFEKSFTELFFADKESSIMSKATITNIITVELLNVFLQQFQNSSSVLPIWLKEILPLFNSPANMCQGLNHILKDITYDKSYLCRVFKKYMNCTMTEYLKNARLEYASTLLLTTDKTLSQICEDVGFESIPYLTVSFKQKYKLTPREFKNNYKQKIKH